MPRRTVTKTRFILAASFASVSAAAQEAPGAPAPATPASAEETAPAQSPSAQVQAAASAPVAPTQAGPAPPMATASAGAGSPTTVPSHGSPFGAPAAAPEEEDPTAHLRFRHTWLTWDNAVSTQTLGVGRSYQSANPTYTMSASFQPRYYLYDGGDVDAVFTEGRIDLLHEFTNSDVTTRRGETILSDTTLTAGYVRVLAARDDYESMFVVRAPVLTLPSSKFSANNGTIAGVGTEARFYQAVPLAGADAPLFQRLIARATVGYNHTFTREVVPTNPDLRRVRLTPEGRTVPGNQLVGVAFPENELALRGRLWADITNRFSWWFEASYQPTWKYGFANVDVCVVTGCMPAARPLDPSTFVVVTAFETELMYDLLPELGVDVGYINVETQPGPDGQRRSIFYSPGAQFYLEFTGYLDAMYAAAKGHRGGPPMGHHLRP